MGNFSRPRVLFFFHETTWSGAPIQLWHLIGALEKIGFETAAAVPKKFSPESGPISELLAQAGRQVFPLVDLSAPPDFEGLRFLCCQFDAVVANTLVMWAAVKAAHSASIPTIWYIHESGVAPQLFAQNPEMKSTFALAGLLVMPTRQTARLYAPFSDRAIEVVPYGIPPATTPRTAARSGATMKFLSLGSYERRKGQDVLLAAIAQMPGQARGKATFRIVGRKLEQEFYEALARHAAVLPNVELFDGLEHDEALAAIASADVLVCASRDETMPIAILEAMSLGKAIVSTNVGGITEWLSHGLNALIVPADDAAALARALNLCLDEPKFVESLGKNARQTFAENFSIDRLGESFAALLERVTTKR